MDRKVELYLGNGSKAMIDFSSIRKGDIISLKDYNPNSPNYLEYVKGKNGDIIFVALEDAHEDRVNCVVLSELGKHIVQPSDVLEEYKEEDTEC